MNSHDNPMGERHAVPFNSGLPVDHSGPELGAGPTTPATADQKSEARPSISISQHKSGQGFRGQSPLVVREAGHELLSEAKQLSSLDHLEINRNSGRGKHCGRWSIRGQVDGISHVHRVNCKTWPCSYCGPRKAKRYKYAIRHTAERYGLNRFLTLTLDPAKISGEPVQFLNATFAKFRIYLKRQYKVAPNYIRILEFHKSGNPHFHILIDRFIPQEWIAEAWSSLGGGRIVDIRQVDLHRVSRYLSKYLTKELLMSAPSRSRRVTTSRGITLIEKTESKTDWELLRCPIWILFERFTGSVLTFALDEDGVLKTFAVSKNND